MDQAKNIPVLNDTIRTDYWCFTESKRYECNLTWIINNLSLYFNNNKDSVNPAILSPSFSSSDSTCTCTWYLELHPTFTRQTYDERYGGYFKNTRPTTLYLKAVDKSEIGENGKFGPILGELQTSILDSEDKIYKTEKNNFAIGDDNTTFEMKSFISDHELFDEENKLLVKDVLKIHCRISFIQQKDTVSILNQCTLDPFGKSEYKPMKDFEKLFNNEDCSDVAIYIGDKKYPAHKSILAARSPVFKAMFTHSMEENRSNRIDIKDIEEDLFKEVLRYVYTGKVENLETVAFELLLVADKYNIEGLKCMCENAICGTISIETVLKILLFSEMHNLKTLKMQAMKYIRAHTAEVIESQGWDDFSSRPGLVKELFEAHFKHQI